MSRQPGFLAMCLLSTLAVMGCGGSSTSPQDDGPASFSRMMGSTPDHETDVMGVAVLSDGTRMVCGEFEGSLHVTAFPDSITAGGTERNFLAAFRPDGSLASMTTIAGGAVAMRRMARDRDDNLLLTGFFSGSTNFGGVPFTAVSADLIFAKLDRSGNAVWVQTGSASGADGGSDITAAADGSVYMTGLATGEMTVAGEDVGQSGSTTGFLVKLRSDGVGVWQQTAGVSGGGSACNAVAVSVDGTVVACGTYNSPTLDFAGDVLDHGSGSSDSFVGRFASDGTPMGSIHIQSAGIVNARDVTTIANDVIVTGSLDATTDFAPGASGGAVKTKGGTDAFVARYSEAGELRWVKTFGPGDLQIGVSVAPLAGGNILVCGQFINTITLGSKTLTAAGNTDIFVARLDGNGSLVSAIRYGGPGEEEGLMTTTTGSTAVVVGGTGSDQIVFPDGTRTRRGIFDGYIFQQP
jgi:hypothetical protein